MAAAAATVKEYSVLQFDHSHSCMPTHTDTHLQRKILIHTQAQKHSNATYFAGLVALEEEKITLI